MYRLRAATCLLVTTAVIGCVATEQQRPRQRPRAKTDNEIFLPAIAVNYSWSRGVGLTYGHCEDMGLVAASWQYGWTLSPRACAGRENVPMVNGSGPLTRLLDGSASLGGNSRYILGFNEPDLSSDPKMAPPEAAKLWRQLEQWVDANFAPGEKLLVAPAPSHLNTAEQGGYVDWLQRFYDAYVGEYGAPPRLHALAGHCYQFPVIAADGSVEEPEFCKGIVEYYGQKIAQWGIPGGLWMTEFGFPARCEFSCTTQAVDTCDTDYFRDNPGECDCLRRILTADDGSLVASCDGQPAPCACYTLQPGQQLCTRTIDGVAFLEASCELAWPIEGDASDCSCSGLSEATTVCVQQQGCRQRTSCGRTCNWDPAIETGQRFIRWLKTLPYASRRAWFAARIKGTEYWANNIGITTRLLSCSDDVLDVGCTEPQLTPGGLFYRDE